ncbi:MAG: 2-C-methyl-D-erythritol 2,4-cyclodiphosphate synthase, partial [Clostridiales bacterium]|nr:2-C-methyl-D-erythritol 2,4-cyclodiphosphate synthase [Candidatus Equinaster intestinalis]
AALGDIGKHFPDNDPKYKGISSRILLREVAKKLENAGYKIGNIDVTLVAQAPKISPYTELMRKNIAEDCNIDINSVNVKATTEEGLGFTGEKLGISATAVALIL